jgi:hypothetical protein
MGEVVPCTAFIDREGRIAARVLGTIRREELKERIEWLLDGRTTPAPPALVKHVGD